VSRAALTKEKYPPDGKANERWRHFRVVAQKQCYRVVKTVPESIQQFTTMCVI
jgi:hypothetical protein